MRSPIRAARRVVGDRLRRRPAVAARAATALRRLGRTTAAEAVERAVDVVAVAAPSGGVLHLARCEGRDQVARQAAAEGWRSFEDPLPAVLVALVRAYCRGGRFGDVGANTGYYALLAADAEPTVEVDAFEPYPPVLEVLRRNVELNGADRVCVHPVALAAAPGTATLYVPLADHGLVETSSSLNPTFDATRIGSEVTVAVDTLDGAYPERGPALLKVDVESLEPEVLAGGAALLDRDQPLLVLELLPHEDPARLERARAAHGYVDIRLRPGAAVVGAAVRADADAWNHLWCPAPEVDAVCGLLARTGLAVVDERA